MENQKSTPTNFVATVYGNLVPLNNSALSKARLKIFYKGMNRNGSYINEEIAEKLISTLPGTPVVGYYDSDKDDFLGHVSPESNRAYGFVPEEMNFKWEMFLDPDGVYRTYACTDIILWTGRYPIASKIVGKSHSMELNPDTVEGEWVEHDDEYYFEFTNAEFFGLCVLGEEYEPCFEGSSFYELHQQENNSSISKDLKEMFSLYKSTIDSAEENPTGGQEMEDEKLKPQDLDNDSVEEEVKDQEEEVKEEENKDVIKRETKVRKIKQRKSLYEIFNASNGRIFEAIAFLLTSFLVAFSGLYVGKTSPFGMLLGIPMCIIGICIIYLGDREANILDVVSCAFTYLSVGMLIGQIISALIYGFTLATLFYVIGSLCLASYILACQYTTERRINIILYFSFIMFAIAILMF